MPRLSKEGRNLWRDWIAHPCIGYPDCDGDLEGEPHSAICPASHRPEFPSGATIESLLDTCDALEREKAELLAALERYVNSQGLSGIKIGCGCFTETDVHDPACIESLRAAIQNAEKE